jgi:hypothetical protein
MCRNLQSHQQSGCNQPLAEGTVAFKRVAHTPALVPAASPEASTDSLGIVVAATQQPPTQQSGSCITEYYAQGLNCPRLSAADKKTALEFPGNVHNLSLQKYARTRRADKTYDLPYWSAPAVWYWQVTGEDWDKTQESLSKAKAIYTNIILQRASQKQRERREAKRKRAEEDAEKELQLRFQQAQQNWHQMTLEALLLPLPMADPPLAIQGHGSWSPAEFN